MKRSLEALRSDQSLLVILRLCQMADFYFVVFLCDKHFISVGLIKVHP